MQKWNLEFPFLKFIIPLELQHNDSICHLLALNHQQLDTMPLNTTFTTYVHI